MEAICQSFSLHWQHHFVLAKLATRSMRVKYKIVINLTYDELIVVLVVLLNSAENGLLCLGGQTVHQNE